jgi:uncharacterized protein
MHHVLRTVLLILCLVPAGLSRADDEGDRVQLARELIAVNRMVQNMDAMMPTIMNALKPAITRGDPRIEKDYDAIVQLMYREFEPYKAQMMDDFARIAARAYTKTELEEILAFSKSATGQKMISMTPVLSEAGMKLGQSYGQKIAAQVGEKMKAELRKRGHNI